MTPTWCLPGSLHLNGSTSIRVSLYKHFCGPHLLLAAATYHCISIVNSDEEPPEEDEQQDIDDPQDLNDEDDEDGSQRGHEDEDEEGSQHDLEGLDSDTLKHRFANEVGSFTPLSQLMIILQHIQWGCEYGAQDDDEAGKYGAQDDDEAGEYGTQDDDEADRQDDDPHHPAFNAVDEHLDFGDHNDDEEEEEETTRARKVWWFPNTYNLLLTFINRRSGNMAWSTVLR